jgi:class 3 adenylate cyclase
MRLGSTALATGRLERRLAAILAVDVAGYSRLMGADEEGTHERLKAQRRAPRKQPPLLVFRELVDVI